MKLHDAARELIGSGANATLVTLNPDGSPQVSLVWVALQPSPDHPDTEDELVVGHLTQHKKVRNIRRDPRVALTIIGDGPANAMRPYLSVTGTARIVEGGAPELLRSLAATLTSPDAGFPPEDAPPGYLTRIKVDKVGGVGPWAQ
ncbi:PPOX class F420-dependent oxidoreductase [Mycolicibacterium mengxianglii]|uniref:PPOX class F420-dependent oxidoreductase n=1 Tax=Mycolicibacterium mengxianglii TaxID=2736649 RepID=UPI0018D131FF|nr:PPOX class F420-dependent oxidoreductase [Mycolicibacterium mengxianglii]